MKKYFIFAAAACAALAVSCQKSEIETNPETFTFTATVDNFVGEMSKYSLSSNGNYDLSANNWLSLKMKAQSDAGEGGKVCIVNVKSFDSKTRTAYFELKKYDGSTNEADLTKAKNFFQNSSEMTLMTADQTYEGSQNPFVIRDDTFFSTRVSVQTAQKANLSNGKALPTEYIPMVAYWKGTDAEKGKPVFDLKIACALLKLHIDVEEGETVNIKKINIANGNTSTSHLASKYYWKCADGVYSYKGSSSIAGNVSLEPKSGTYSASGDYYFAIAVHPSINTISNATITVTYSDNSTDTWTNSVLTINKNDIKAANIYKIGTITVPKPVL